MNTDAVMRTTEVVDKIEEDVAVMAAIWFEAKTSDVVQNMEKIGMKAKIREKYRELLISLVEGLH